MAASSSGATGLNAAFLKVQQVVNVNQERLNSVTAAVADEAKAQVENGLVTTASPANDTSSTALIGRGQKLNISI